MFTRYRLPLAFLLVALAVVTGVVIIIVATPQATLEVRNESSRSVTIIVDTRIKEEIAPGAHRTIHAGLLFGRWGAPGGIRVDEIACSWREVKDNEPLVVRDGVAPCTNIEAPIEGGFPGPTP